VSFPITPTQSGIQAALVAFLNATLPGVLVVSGQDNRVSEPPAGDFVVITPIFFDRIETNWDLYADCRCTGQITAQVLNVNAVQIGKVLVGATLFGTGVTPCTVLAQTSGSPGGPGNYTVSVNQTTPANTVFSAGNLARQQNMEWRVQLDFHSGSNPPNLDAGDMAAIFVTQYRSVFATDFFENQLSLGIDALYADEARQVPFINDQQQYEWRWMVEALLQANQVVVVPQQFSDAVTVNLINVPAAYGP
jgi:hypothetical protein